MNLSSKTTSIDHPIYTFLRLVEQYQANERLIIAYDFDDTVSPYHSSNCWRAQSVIRAAREYLNAYLIVYTSNPDEEKVKKFLEKENIPYDVINENAPFVHFNNKGKVYYNLLLDDKAGLHQAINDLETLINGVINGNIRKETVR